jgi:F-type H+-transporting ATPase subunit alpha
MDVTDQVIVIFAGVRGFLDGIDPEDIRALEPQLIKYVRQRHPEIAAELDGVVEYTDEIEQGLERAVSEFVQSWTAGRSRAAAQEQESHDAAQ